MRVDPSLLSGRGVLARTEGPPARLPAAPRAVMGIPITAGWSASASGHWSVTLTVPCKVVSEANARDHGIARWKRFRTQKDILCVLWRGSPLVAASDWHRSHHLTVTFTKLGGRKMDSDNLAGSMKGLRDELARLLNVSDGSDRVLWLYDQRPGTPGVEIRIEPRAAGEGPA